MGTRQALNSKIGANFQIWTPYQVRVLCTATLPCPLHSLPHPAGVWKSLSEHKMASESPYGGPPGSQDRRDEERGLESSQGHSGSSDPSSSSSAPYSHSRNHGNSGSAKLFVGQIPPACSEDDLHHLFSPYGTLHEVVVFRSKNGSEKGTSDSSDFRPFTTLDLLY